MKYEVFFCNKEKKGKSVTVFLNKYTVNIINNNTVYYYYYSIPYYIIETKTLTKMHNILIRVIKMIGPMI